MSTLQTNQSLNFNSNFKESEWVDSIHETLKAESEKNEIPICIFKVPKALLSSDPDSYIPQLVPIGPYHFLRPELREMETYKIAAARKFQNQLSLVDIKFEDLVDQLITTMVPNIRACYHKVLDFSPKTLGWMIATDASFLLQFLELYATATTSNLGDYVGSKSVQNAILRDIIMLENQIPLFVLRKMLEVQLMSRELADDMLLSMLKGLCRELSPFKMVSPKKDVLLSAHFLDFIYYMIVPKARVPKVLEGRPEISIMIDVEDESEAIVDKEKSSQDTIYVKKLLIELWKLLLKLNKGPMRTLQQVLLSKPVKLILKLPSSILLKLPAFSVLRKPVEGLFPMENKEEIKSDNESCNNNSYKPPLVEEITIPSVSELSKSGVRFLPVTVPPTNGYISNICFDKKTKTFYLPPISINANTEVVLRNLVAYEASNGTEELIFTRYTELMCGVIDTEEDVKLLRNRGIIKNHLKSDQAVANLWNEMTKSNRLTKVAFLDKVIEDVNKYHNSRWSVRVRNMVKSYVTGSWQLLTLFAAVLLLLLMLLQALCSVYSCNRIMEISYRSGQ